MTKLRDLQDRFVAALAKPDQADLSWIQINAAQAPLQQLAIYRDSIRETLLKGLSAMFPCCLKLVGEQYWRQVLRAFLRAKPCDTEDYFAYAWDMIAFIRQSPAQVQVPYLADVAYMDWAWDKAYHHAMPKSDQAFPSLSSTTQLALAPSATLLESEFPLTQLWQFCQDETEQDKAFQLDQRRENLLIWLKNGAVHMQALQPAPWRFLQQLEPGRTVQEVAEILNERPATILKNSLKLIREQCVAIYC